MIKNYESSTLPRTMLNLLSTILWNFLMVSSVILSIVTILNKFVSAPRVDAMFTSRRTSAKSLDKSAKTAWRWTNTGANSSEVCDDEFVDAPVFVGTVRKVAPNYNWDLSVTELLRSDLPEKYEHVFNLYFIIISSSSKLLSLQPTNLSRLERILCTCSCAVGKRKYQSVWLLEIGNSCTNVFPNTRTWKQQEWNKIKKQTKTIRREAWVWKEVKQPPKKEVPIAYHNLIKIQ